MMVPRVNVLVNDPRPKPLKPIGLQISRPIRGTGSPGHGPTTCPPEGRFLRPPV